MTPPLSRRAFLTGAGVVGAGAVLAGGRLAWGSLVSDQLEADRAGPGPGGTGTTPGSAPPAGTGRVLVVVQMSGGNDGLNTLIPAGDGRYFDARPTLQVKEADIIRLRGTDRFGFNPVLQPLVPYWDNGQLVAVDGVGLPGQTRSHFAAMDAWFSATPGTAMRDGWLGRWLDSTGDPTNPLRAIALGGSAPALVGDRSVATMVLDPGTFALRTPKGSSPEAIRAAFLATAAPLASDAVLAQAQAAIPDSLAAVDLLAKAKAATASKPGEDPDIVPKAKKGDSAYDVTDLLQTAAGIIDLQLGTQIIVVAAGGFDTHSDQATRHPQLLGDVATGVAQFLDTMRAQGRADDVLVLTTSEFGRRVEENGSGTDHGNGGVQFLVGPMVKGGQVVGQADLGALDDGDLKTSIDTRSLYANALDWLQGPTDEVLGASYDRYGLVRA